MLHKWDKDTTIGYKRLWIDITLAKSKLVVILMSYKVNFKFILNVYLHQGTNELA